MNENMLMENPLMIFDELLEIDDKAFEVQEEEIKAIIGAILNSDDYYKFLIEMTEGASLEVFNKMKEYKEILTSAQEGKFGEVKNKVLINVFKELIANFEEIVNLGGIFKKVPIKVTKVRENAILPKYQSMGDAGADIYVSVHTEVQPGETVVVPSGVKVKIPGGYCIEIVPRSGLSLKSKMRIANTPGTIDCMYRGEVGVIVENIGDEVIKLTEGMRIAQMKLVPIYKIQWEEVSNEEFEGYISDRGAGFGSSGV